MSLARAVVAGTVDHDPEKRFTANQNVAVTTFTMTAETPGRANQSTPETVSLRVTCWRNLADAACEQIKRGDAVMVEGKLMIQTWQAQDGQQQRQFEIEAAALNRLPGLPERIAGAPQAGGMQGGNGQAPSRGAMPVSAPQNPMSNAVPNQMPNQMPGGQPSYGPPMPTAPSGGFAGMTEEELLTEDDIPF